MAAKKATVKSLDTVIFIKKTCLALPAKGKDKKKAIDIKFVKKFCRISLIMLDSCFVNKDSKRYEHFLPII